MDLHKKNEPNYSIQATPIARALHRIDSATLTTMKRKFDIAYFIAKEGLPFTKMAPLCQLEERHGVNLGTGYKNNQACTQFVEFIAKVEQQNLVEILSKARFFSLQADDSTDCATIEDEMYLCLFFDSNGVDGRVHVRDVFFAVRQPEATDAQGLYACLEGALQYMGIDNWKNKLVGFGSDGASVNMAAGGLRGYLEADIPWVVVFWCLAHRLELSLKDALKSTFFSQVDEMLMRLYYLYEKSPKKCRDLDEIAAELKLCLEESELPRMRGNKPLRACGTRFVSHKVSALGRFIDKFGIYLSHLTMLAEQPGIKSVDKQKIKGYILRWRDSKMLLGSAFFHDLLKPAAILCKALQEDEVCVVRAAEALIKALKMINTLKTTRFENLPTVKKVISRLTVEDTGNMSYQCVDIKKHDLAVAFLKSNYGCYTESVLPCLRDRIKAHHMQLLTHVLTVLATNGWEKEEETSFGHDALHALTTKFIVPLNNASVDCSVIVDEWDVIFDYAKRYLDLVREDYKVTWWKLFQSSDAKNWSNILVLVELLFCIPVANGRVERLFSHLKVIKSNRRSTLGEDRLDQLLRIKVDAPPLAQWDPSAAVDLWWKDKTRRVNHRDTRAAPSGPSHRNADPEHDTACSSFSLEDWETWFVESEMDSDDDI